MRLTPVISGSDSTREKWDITSCDERGGRGGGARRRAWAASARMRREGVGTVVVIMPLSSKLNLVSILEQIGFLIVAREL
jgi:hypothetical protein